MNDETRVSNRFKIDNFADSYPKANLAIHVDKIAHLSIDIPKFTSTIASKIDNSLNSGQYQEAIEQLNTISDFNRGVIRQSFKELNGKKIIVRDTRFSNKLIDPKNPNYKKYNGYADYAALAISYVYAAEKLSGLNLTHLSQKIFHTIKNSTDPEERMRDEINQLAKKIADEIYPNSTKKQMREVKKSLTEIRDFINIKEPTAIATISRQTIAEAFREKFNNQKFIDNLELDIPVTKEMTGENKIETKLFERHYGKNPADLEDQAWFNKLPESIKPLIQDEEIYNSLKSGTMVPTQLREYLPVLSRNMWSKSGYIINNNGSLDCYQAPSFQSGTTAQPIKTASQKEKIAFTKDSLKIKQEQTGADRLIIVSLVSGTRFFGNRSYIQQLKQAGKELNKEYKNSSNENKSNIAINVIPQNFFRRFSRKTIDPIFSNHELLTEIYKSLNGLKKTDNVKNKPIRLLNKYYYTGLSHEQAVSEVEKWIRSKNPNLLDTKEKKQNLENNINAYARFLQASLEYHYASYNASAFLSWDRENGNLKLACAMQRLVNAYNQLPEEHLVSKEKRQKIAINIECQSGKDRAGIAGWYHHLQNLVTKITGNSYKYQPKAFYEKAEFWFFLASNLSVLFGLIFSTLATVGFPIPALLAGGSLLIFQVFSSIKSTLFGVMGCYSMCQYMWTHPEPDTTQQNQNKQIEETIKGQLNGNFYENPRQNTSGCPGIKPDSKGSIPHEIKEFITDQKLSGLTSDFATFNKKIPSPPNKPKDLLIETQKETPSDSSHASTPIEFQAIDTSITHQRLLPHSSSEDNVLNRNHHNFRK